ncbi:hypothetical protein RirG_078080 [Rhizophagus irregularis DAOM 197198w]|uniref:Uncharacterized protein n=1 Tax=Rhizophagus irregularis (strain DAOM 197198w) TaxID=1432141 RepID=A0A015MXF9_RHIIW|nr:hypothetical protein RirG_078080 [Rhizophagus irregularis DAOM 197198w]
MFAHIEVRILVTGLPVLITMQFVENDEDDDVEDNDEEHEEDEGLVLLLRHMINISFCTILTSPDSVSRFYHQKKIVFLTCVLQNIH